MSGGSPVCYYCVFGSATGSSAAAFSTPYSTFYIHTHSTLNVRYFLSRFLFSDAERRRGPCAIWSEEWRSVVCNWCISLQIRLGVMTIVRRFSFAVLFACLLGLTRRSDCSIDHQRRYSVRQLCWYAVSQSLIGFWWTDARSSIEHLLGHNSSQRSTVVVIDCTSVLCLCLCVILDRQQAVFSTWLPPFLLFVTICHYAVLSAIDLLWSIHTSIFYYAEWQQNTCLYNTQATYIVTHTFKF